MLPFNLVFAFLFGALIRSAEANTPECSSFTKYKFCLGRRNLKYFCSWDMKSRTCSDRPRDEHQCYTKHKRFGCRRNRTLRKYCKWAGLGKRCVTKNHEEYLDTFRIQLTDQKVHMYTQREPYSRNFKTLPLRPHRESTDRIDDLLSTSISFIGEMKDKYNLWSNGLFTFDTSEGVDVQYNPKWALRVQPITFNDWQIITNKGDYRKFQKVATNKCKSYVKRRSTILLCIRHLPLIFGKASYEKRTIYRIGPIHKRKQRKHAFKWKTKN